MNLSPEERSKQSGGKISQSGRAFLKIDAASSPTVPDSLEFSGSDPDVLSVALGALMLVTIGVPWIVGTGTFTVSHTALLDTSVNLITFVFPFAQYSYSTNVFQGVWSTYSLIQYVSIAFLLTGSTLVIVTSVLSRFKNVAVTGVLFSALAPIVFLGFSQSSTPTTQSVFVSNFVTFPAGAFLPIFLGFLVVERIQTWDETRSSSIEAFTPTRSQIPNISPIVQFCPACGIRLALNAKSCPACGRNLAATSNKRAD